MKCVCGHVHTDSCPCGCSYAEEDLGRDETVSVSTLTRYADALGVTINIHNPRATQPKTVAEQVESPTCMEA